MKERWTLSMDLRDRIAGYLIEKSSIGLVQRWSYTDNDLKERPDLIDQLLIEVSPKIWETIIKPELISLTADSAERTLRMKWGVNWTKPYSILIGWEGVKS